ncbi:MAG: lactate dehydrogenase [Spirochaetae bacterium HGW-Spirochaetae-7]|jgi:LDH2 family malate/lactate/ureidoglycolate dehydrogenase|nr:MAG: lactate dehydrogenase [Spirochaetae bacterium HGW-Spirochaetae-7]
MSAFSTEGAVWWDFDTVERFMVDVFKGFGVPPEDARICADVLITADKRGIDSHGVGRLKPIYIDRIKEKQINPVTKIDIIREGPTTAVLDANNGMGQVVSVRGMQMAIDKARKFGMGMVAVRNSNHYGIAGYYSLMAIKAGMIGFTGTNARPSIAPTFGVENMLGTNPLTFGIPTDEDFPFVIDCATSVSQRGKIEVYARQKKDLPPGWVIGADGKTKTDSVQVLEDLVKGTAALTPVGGIGEEGGGYKGYGWAAVVEILSSALQQGAFLKSLLGFENGKKVPYKLGHFFMAIDINAFTDVPSFKKTAGDICRQLRASKKAPGQDRIWTAGEPEWDAWQDRKTKGVPLDEVERAQFEQLQAELGLSQYTFPWKK